MSAILGASIDLNKIPSDAIKEVKLKNGGTGRYVNLSVFVNDELDQFNNQVGVALSQTKEEREAKSKKVYLGNGSVNYVSDSGVTKASGGEDLPF